MKAFGLDGRRMGCSCARNALQPRRAPGFLPLLQINLGFSLAHPEPAPFPSLPDLCCLQGQLQRESLDNPWGWEHGRDADGDRKTLAGPSLESDAFIQHKPSPQISPAMKGVCGQHTNLSSHEELNVFPAKNRAGEGQRSKQGWCDQRAPEFNSLSPF